MASILARMKNNDGTNTYSLPEMRAHLHTFIFAGFDTTASTLHWILFYVGKFPAYAKRVANELEENGGVINSKILKNVPFTTAFIKEVLRLTHIVDCIGTGLTQLFLRGRAQRESGCVILSAQGYSDLGDFMMATDLRFWFKCIKSVTNISAINITKVVTISSTTSVTTICPVA